MISEVKTLINNKKKIRVLKQLLYLINSCRIAKNSMFTLENFEDIIRTLIGLENYHVNNIREYERLLN